MPVSKPTPTPSHDQGCIVLVVPHGGGRGRRLIIPHDVGIWLRDELCAAIDELQAERQAWERARRLNRKYRGPVEVLELPKVSFGCEHDWHGTECVRCGLVWEGR